MSTSRRDLMYYQDVNTPDTQPILLGDLFINKPENHQRLEPQLTELRRRMLRTFTSIGLTLIVYHNSVKLNRKILAQIRIQTRVSNHMHLNLRRSDMPWTRLQLFLILDPLLPPDCHQCQMSTYIYLNKLNLWLSAPKGATPVNQTPATDMQIAVRPYNVISISLCQVY